MHIPEWIEKLIPIAGILVTIAGADIPHRGPDFGEFLSVQPGIAISQELEEVLVFFG
jgi:hypothetical protein